MWRDNRKNDISFNEIDKLSIEINRKNGFEKYEEKYHQFEMRESEKYQMDGMEIFCESNEEKVNEMVGAIDEYVKERILNVIDTNQPDIEKIFVVDDFIDIVNPYGRSAMVPAICYWEILKQTFLTYYSFENNKWEHSIQYRSYETRVQNVTEILMILCPTADFVRWEYQFIAGKEPEILNKFYETISEKIVDASDATIYLIASLGLGCLKVVENAVEYGGAALEFFTNNKVNAEKIISLEITENLKNKLDEWYGRDNWVSAISNSVERFGTTATYIGLSMLVPTGGVKAVVAGIGLVLGKAGEITKQDFSKTGELTFKELVHGAVTGAVALGCVELGKIAVEKLCTSTPAIAKEINNIFGGNVDPKLLKSLTTAMVNGFESSVVFASYDVPEQISKELECVLGIDSNAKAEWMQTLKGVGTAMLTAAIFTFIGEVYVNNGFYSTYEERISHTPIENGQWTGERGESAFISDSNEVSKYLKDANEDGVTYKDGCPDFKPFSKGEVEISSMSSNRHTVAGKPGNFEQADEALARLRGNGCTARDVANWRKANKYTWHELNDMKTCQKVPIMINKNYRHLGGVSECKHREDMLNKIIGKNINEGGIFDE